MRIEKAAIAALGLLLATAAHPAPAVVPAGGFSIVARDAATGDLGVALASRAPAAGAHVAWVRAGVGAAAVSGTPAGDIGERLLDLLEQGIAPRETLTRLLDADLRPERRQIGVVDAAGVSATHTGRETTAWSGAIEESGFSVQGNRLAGRGTLEAMATSFRSTDGVGLTLEERLLRALEAGGDAEGDHGDLRSAALRVGSGDAQRSEGPARDLRVDDADAPIRELRRIHDRLTGVLGYRRLGQPAGHDVVELQRLLRAAGVYTGEPSGVYDDATVAAVEAFRRAHGMDTGPAATTRGLADAELIRRLREALHPAAGTREGEAPGGKP